MALVFEQINSGGLAQLSYIVGDDQAGVAAVTDTCGMAMILERMPWNQQKELIREAPTR